MAKSVAQVMERKALEKMIDGFFDRSEKKDISGSLMRIVDIVQKVMGSNWQPESYERLYRIINDPENKWSKYARRLFSECDREVLKTFALNAVFEAGLCGYKIATKKSEEYNCNIPWVILMDPTTACNMHCKGCWAAEYGDKMNLSYEDMDRIITEGKELGIYAYLFTGGEPLIRKKDIIKLCEKNPDCAFHAFTNGTLIDEEFCDEMLRVKNFFVSVSVEGFEEVNDSRRGEGDFQTVMDAMDLMKKKRLPFGISVCYTSKNYKSVTSDEFIDLLIEKGCYFAWYFHYMPVGKGADTDLLLKPDQRAYMHDRIREIRSESCDKELFAIDFQNDGEYVNGCVAAGDRYCHINANGDVEPCVFIHYSNANIHDHSLLECLQQPLFMAYRENQPFNDNMLRPCPMLENPEFLKEIVKKTGAKSTDLEAPENADDLCAKCEEYAEEWKPVAEELWADSPYYTKVYHKKGNKGNKARTQLGNQDEQKDEEKQEA